MRRSHWPGKGTSGNLSDITHVLQGVRAVSRALTTSSSTCALVIAVRATVRVGEIQSAC